ncbi:hypothetical protein M405DRAFT_904995 [Rhizopogon salebrosus TDB-379]|nr:hypothetical protein M405DRAFT_904995 [Rhizopogon salebrosus TDB-379]
MTTGRVQHVLCMGSLGMGKVDEFTEMLWMGWKNIWEHGMVQERLGARSGTMHSRLDYLLHAAGDRLSLKQVEFNTISLSFRPLSEHAAAMHNTSAIFYTIIKVILLGRHEVHVTRRAFTELAISASLDPSTHALASDKTTGKLNRITITNDKEEIERMVNETEIQGPLLLLNQQGEACRQFDPADKSKLTSAISVAISWLDASQEDWFTNCLPLEGGPVGALSRRQGIQAWGTGEHLVEAPHEFKAILLVPKWSLAFIWYQGVERVFSMPLRPGSNSEY